MPELKNRAITLASRPIGEPKDDNFKLVELPVPSAGEGEVLLKTLFLSLDPYMRGRMSDAKSYAQPVAIGGVMEGGTVCEVVSSKYAKLAQGDVVLAYTGWQEYAVAKGEGLRKIENRELPLSTALGVMGMPGMTAYTGLLNIGKPKSGETVVVAAATGPVGSAVGQIAKIKGARAIGIAGGTRKCEHALSDFGFDACLDHKDPNFAEKLAEACPQGIDVYFENVGGAVFEAVLPLLNNFARIPVCGLIAQYNSSKLPDGPDKTQLLMRNILTKRLEFRGFIVSDFNAQMPEFSHEMATWIKSGQVKYLEDVVDGLENTPKAFQGLLRGDNFGKLVVRFQ